MSAVAAPSISFNEAEHSYHVNGRPVPSVTKLLQIIQMLEGIPWETLEAARIFGSNVHRAVHLDNMRQLNFEKLSPILQAYVQGYRLFMRDTQAVVFASEMPVASPLHGYAGMLDWFGTLSNEHALIDVKSTAALPFTVGPQTAAYGQGLLDTTGQKVKKRYCLHLGPNRYKLVQLKDPQDFTYFLSCTNVVKLMQRCGKIERHISPF